MACTVESTITVARSLRAMSFKVSATWMVCASSASTPSSPRAFLNRTRSVGSHGQRCSKYARPEKYCQVGVSLQRSTTPSSLSL